MNRFAVWAGAGLALVGLMIGCPSGYAGSTAVPADAATVALAPVVTGGLEKPLFLTHAGDGSDRLYVLEQPGRIRLLEHGVLSTAPFLDLTDRVLMDDTERGLLGLAFHPDYRRNGRLFVNYTRRPDGATVVAEYRRGRSPEMASRDEQVLLVIL